jgi:hypothetical protein
MAIKVVCPKCDNVFRVRKGLSSRCPKCQSSVDDTQLKIALASLLALVAVMFILALSGVITWDQFNNGFH